MAATHYYISAGSNVGDARDNVVRAIGLLRDMLDDFAASAVYSTPSVSLGDDSVYFNAVVGGCSCLSEAELSLRLKEIERQFGREHGRGNHCVELDLDVVVAGEEIVRPRDFNRRYFQIGFEELTGKA